MCVRVIGILCRISLGVGNGGRVLEQRKNLKNPPYSIVPKISHSFCMTASREENSLSYGFSL